MRTTKTPYGILIVVDLHNHAVWQAKEKIIESLKKIDKGKGMQGLYLIHGFHGGTKIRDYIRNGPLKLSIKDRGISGKIINGDGGGKQMNAISLIVIQEN